MHTKWLIQIKNFIVTIVCKNAMPTSNYITDNTKVIQNLQYLRFGQLGTIGRRQCILQLSKSIIELLLRKYYFSHPRYNVQNLTNLIHYRKNLINYLTTHICRVRIQSL